MLTVMYKGIYQIAHTPMLANQSTHLFHEYTQLNHNTGPPPIVSIVTRPFFYCRGTGLRMRLLVKVCGQPHSSETFSIYYTVCAFHGCAYHKLQNIPPLQCTCVVILNSISTACTSLVPRPLERG